MDVRSGAHELVTHEKMDPIILLGPFASLGAIEIGVDQQHL